MAVRETRIDDIDGSTDGVKTLTFAIDSTTYEVDLSAANRAALVAALSPYIEVARRTSAPAKRPQRSSRGSGGSAVRQWARDNGIPVPDRGRIPKHISDAYAAQHMG